MQFNDTSTYTGLVQLCETLTGLDGGGISGNTILLKQFTQLINSAYHKVDTMILNAQDGWDFDDLNKTDFPIATAPLVASQRDYALPTKVLKVKRVDVTYDGTNWNKAEPFDSGQTGMGLGNDTVTDGRFSKSAPFFDLISNSVLIYPMASASEVTAGAKLRVEYSREVTEFTSASTTTEPGIDEPFHPLIAYTASYIYLIGKDPAKADRVGIQAQEMEARLKQYYSNKETEDQQFNAGYVSYS